MTGARIEVCWEYGRGWLPKRSGLGVKDRVEPAQHIVTIRDFKRDWRGTVPMTGVLTP